jgi:subfamily B ATP-binding cassette protein MsbA
MASSPPSQRWLASFRRTLGYLRPHRRPLIMGLCAAVFVGLFYTSGISSIIPALKIIFADHETLVDWVDRAEAARRLGVVLAADVPDDPGGLLIISVRTNSPNYGRLHDGDRVLSVDGRALSAYATKAALAQSPDTEVPARIVTSDDKVRDLSLRLQPYRGWWGLARDVAARLPTGRTSDQRFLTLVVAVGVIVVITLLGSVCRFANEALVAVAVQRAMHDIRCDMAQRVLRLPVNWHSSHAVGDTLGRFSTDLSRVETGVWTLFGKTITEPMKALGVLVLTILIDWRILVIALLGLPLAALLLRGFGKLVRRAQRRASQSWGMLLDHLDERLAGIRVVKAYNMQAAESARFASEGQTLRRAQTHIEMVDAATKPALEVLATLAVGGFILYGGARVFSHEIEPHMFFGAVVCLGGMFDPVRKLGNVNNRVQAADAAASRVFELIDAPSEEAAGDAQRPALPPFRESIEFRDVSFSYAGSGGRPAISDVSLTVRKGQVVAIAGPNGSGKTTLVSLLLRFFEPTRGAIHIDGRNIAEVSLASLRAQLGLVTQDAVIFSGTVRENIVYGANGVTPAALQRAAQLARVEDFLDDLKREHAGRLTHGLDAEINARQLSGGQRQRLALARAILRDPPILILDEATSQVDSESERRIQDALEELMRGRTTFVIAHRFSTIARADLVVVMNEGRVVSIGRHDELLRTCPIYVALCQTQFAHAETA